MKKGGFREVDLEAVPPKERKDCSERGKKTRALPRRIK